LEERSLQGSGEGSDQVRFLVFEHRAKVDYNLVIFDARDDGDRRAAAKALFKMGGGMAFAADVKHWSAKALRWRRTTAGE
jgi:hypothetical protein